ncbi:Fe-S-like protein [Marinomonas sp. S3726]|nr:Fe-S-like protein [Marinomonas sp. S3726]
MSLCCLDDEDVCIGCHRSVKEITAWGRMKHQERKETMQRVAEREQASGRMMR